MKDQYGKELTDEFASEVGTILFILDSAHRKFSSIAMAAALVHELGTLIASQDFPVQAFEETIKGLKERVKLAMKEIQEEE